MKKRDIILIIFIFISVFSIIIVKPLGDLDEIWNYNTARAIAEGNMPYKDISMITTPILPMITAVFLKLITNELIISRVLAACLWTGILFTTYKILKELVKEENISLIFTFLIGMLCRNIFCIDYNIMTLFLALVILFIELKNKDNDILVGILAGIAICTKHSIGATLAIIVLGNKLLFVENKKQLKECFKQVGKRLIGIFIPVLIVFIYLLIIGAITDFINYAVLGISTFSNSIPYTSLFENEKIEIKVLSILVPITLVIITLTLILSKFLKKNTDDINKLLKMLVYSLSIIIVIYPISDEIHFLISSIISIIGLIYIIYLPVKMIYNKINLNKKHLICKIIALLVMLILVGIIMISTINKIRQYVYEEKNTELKHFSGIIISEGLKKKIQIIDEFIVEREKEGKKVYILDAEAAVYMITLDKYNKDYDMFLKGNIGKDSEQGQIEKIKNRKENELYLIRRKDMENNWQTPTKVISYIRNNLIQVGEVGIFEIYK